MRDALNEAKVEANLRAKSNKALGAAEQKYKELTAKLTAEEWERKSTEVGLKNSQNQAKK